MATPTFGNRAPQDAQAARMMAQVDLSVVPEKPVITLENMFDPETDYEKWLTKLTWNDFERGVRLRNEFIATLPVIPGPADNSDVIPPGATPESITPPEHWLKVPIHFTPLPDPRHTRPVYLSKQYFTFTRKESVRELFARIYAGQRPKRILDIGTG
ncbi:MAG: hypothetical protein NZ518_01535, partial [Dehalococcoidia bacterium]|nr:hypothetical protein [Dehalococcoidia bacterium]